MARAKREKIINKYVVDETWRIDYFQIEGGRKCHRPKNEEEYNNFITNLNGHKITILRYSNEEGKLSEPENLFLSPEEIQNPPYEIRIAISKRYKTPPKRHSLENKTTLKSQ